MYAADYARLTPEQKDRHRELRREKDREYYARLTPEQKDKKREQRREWDRKAYALRPETKRRKRWSSIWTKYKLTEAAYNRKFLSQNGRCAVCKTPTEELCVDHSHACCPGGYTCGRCVRGLLCWDCNKHHFNDNIALLYAYIDYLNYWRNEHARIPSSV